jgi:cobyric acid synthase
LLTRDGHLHVLSTTPASGKTVITTGLIRALRNDGRRVLPFKPVSETVLFDGVPAMPEAVDHQCFAAGVAFIPAVAPIRTVVARREADVWLYEDYVGRVPRLGRDMPALATLSADARQAMTHAIADCRAALLERCDILVSEGSGAATALAEIGLADEANIGTGALADEVLLVARASNGSAFTTADRVISVLRERSVNVTGFMLNDVPGCRDAHIEAAQEVAKRNDIEFVGVMPWTDFFENRPKYSPPSPGCDEDHQHLADLINSVLRLSAVLE